MNGLPLVFAPRSLPRPSLAALAVFALVPLVVPQTAQHRFVGPDLEVLPLTDEEILELLRTARVVDRERISAGVNGIDRVTLEKNGLRVRAGFREVEYRKDRARVGGLWYQEFRDSYLFEPAAYRLSRALGIPDIPPTVVRRIGSTDGSLQLWIEDVVEDSGEVQPDDALAYARQLWHVAFFDALVFNPDRNPGNILVDRRHRLWMIDHTRAFQRKSEPFQLQRVTHVGRDVWERLQTLRRSDYDEVFRGLLEAPQIGFFMDRRDKLIEHINALIAEHGVDAVLF